MGKSYIKSYQLQSQSVSGSFSSSFIAGQVGVKLTRCPSQRLKQRMSDQYYKKKYQIADSSTSFDDIPSASKRANFRRLHPYYFILQELCERGEKKCRAEALELRDMPKAYPETRKTPKRSHSFISNPLSLSASDAGTDSIDSIISTKCSYSSRSAPSRPKKMRPSGPDSSSAPMAEVRPLRIAARPPPFGPSQSSLHTPTMSGDLKSLPGVGASLFKKGNHDSSGSDTDSDSVIGQASAMSDSSSIVFLPGPPPGSFLPRKLEEEHAPERPISAVRKLVVTNKDPLVSMNNDKPERGPDKTPSRDYKKKVAMEVEAEESTSVLGTEYENVHLLNPSELGRLSNLVLRRRFIQSKQELNPHWYDSGILDWMDKYGNRERYARQRATLELGLELIRRWSERSNEAHATLSTYKFHFPTLNEGDILVSEMSELIVKLGGIDTLGERLYYFARSFRHDPVRVISKGALFVSSSGGVENDHSITSMGISSNFTIGHTETWYRTLTTDPAKRRWQKKHCICVVLDEQNPLSDARSSDEWGCVMTPMGFANYISELREKKKLSNAGRE
nr:uncharacterized protein I203_00938 [Kwoniella mangroviensis CBS 8507]OCF69087.1 hypothetical protein I203_00938 [Kwoniella mangroviensis CBS 8507]